MRDINVIKEILTRAKIQFSEGLDSDKILTLTVDSGSRDGPNRGYSGFFTEMGFDNNGNLLYMGAWE